MKRILLAFAVSCLALTACEMPDTEGLNKTPKITAEMSEKMSSMTEAVRLQKLAEALKMLNDPNNQKDIDPIPFGLWAGGKLFAENATTEEMVDYIYLKSKQLEEGVPVAGIDEAGNTVYEQNLAKVRVEKKAILWSLCIIASYAQDSKINEVVNGYVLGNHNRQSTGLALLAMRGMFIREIILGKSFKFRDGVNTLKTSGAMKDAVAWLEKLEYVSRLDFSAQRLVIEFSIVDRSGDKKLINEGEVHDATTRAMTREFWETAYNFAQASVSQLSANNTGSTSDQSELSLQQQYVAKMQSKLEAWGPKP